MTHLTVLFSRKMNILHVIWALMTIWCNIKGSLGTQEAKLQQNIHPASSSCFIIKLNYFRDENVPISIWYDAENKFSRIDANAGILKLVREKNDVNVTFWGRFSRGDRNEYCVKYSHAFDLLPYFINVTGANLQSNFKFIGEETFRGVKTEKWYNETTEITVYMRHQNSSRNPAEQIRVPLVMLFKYRGVRRKFEITSYSDEKPDSKLIKSPLENIKCLDDLTMIDWKDNYTISNKKNFSVPEDLYKNPPETFDWRKLGGVVKRKDQCDLGTSWACVAAAVIEGGYFAHSNRSTLIRLSKQSLMDCSVSWDAYSELDTRMEDVYAYEWIVKNGGIPDEDQYPGPNTGMHETCKTQNATYNVKITGWASVPFSKDEVALKAALIHHGPLSTYIRADKRAFENLTDKIYEDPYCGDLNYRLMYPALLVGYGKENGKDYWTINPFWGSNFGQEGYIKTSTCVFPYGRYAYYVTF